VRPRFADMSDRILEAIQRNVFVILVLAAGGAVEVAMSRSAIISDAWYSLLGGRFVVSSGLPHHDTLTIFTQTREWVDQQWLGHLMLYGLWSAGGWPLLVLSIVLLYVTAMGLAAATAQLFGASARSVSLIALLCFLTGLPNTVIRAQILAYPLFALVLLLVLRDEKRPSRQVFLVLPLLVFWANVHGSVVVGAGLVALRGAVFVVEMLKRRTPPAAWAPRAAILLFAPWLCVLASPYALALPGYYNRTLGNPSFGHSVSEWSPSTVHNQPLFFIVLLLGLWLAFGHGRALGTFARLTLLVSALGGLLAIRNVVWFALVAAAVLPGALDSAWPERAAERHRRFNLALVAAALVGFSLVAATALAHPTNWFERDFPRSAANAVAATAAADPTMKVFASERYSDWLLFEHPSLDGRLAYDIRFEMLTPRQLQSVYDFIYQKGSDWQRAASGYTLLVLDTASEKNVIKSYLRLPRTQTIYRDQHVVVLKLSKSAAE
jgi:hypothetical protein